MLASIKMPVYDIKRYVLEMNEQILTIDLLYSLRSIAPTAEEREIMRSYRGDHTKLAKAGMSSLESLPICYLRLILSFVAFIVATERYLSRHVTILHYAPI